MKYWFCSFFALAIAGILILFLGCAEKPKLAPLIPVVFIHDTVQTPKPILVQNAYKRPISIQVPRKHIEPLHVPAPVFFATGKSSVIPKGWADTASLLCKYRRVIVTGSASTDGSKVRNRDLALERASKAAGMLTCPESNVLLRAVTGKNRSVSVEVIR